MVPHSLICAKLKRYKNTESPEVLPGTWQTADKFARICQHSLSTPRKHLHHQIAPPCGGQWQQFHCFNTNAHRRQGTDDQRWYARRSQGQRRLSCVICECPYNEMSGILAITPCSAAGAVSPDRFRAHNCGSSQPDQPIQEPRLSPISQAAIRSSVLEANNRPTTDGCFIEAPNITAIYAS